MATLTQTQPAFPLSYQPLPATVRVNQGEISQSQIGWLRPTPVDTPIEEMRQRLEADGYIYIKGLLPREDVLKMRSHYFEQFKDTGLLLPGSDPVEGRYNTEDDVALHRGLSLGRPDGEELRRVIDAHVTPEYLDFVAHPALRKMVRDLMDWDKEVLLNRTLLRHQAPGAEGTGVHYDQLFLRAGSAFFLTAWIPIGDIKHTGGGLTYLDDSLKLAQAIEDDFSERAKSFTLEQKLSAFNQNMEKFGVLANHPARFQNSYQHIAESAGMKDRPYHWRIADYEAGDVVFHHPYSIHSACLNSDAEFIRLSTDLRFHDQKDFDEGTIDKRWTKVWTPDDGL